MTIAILPSFILYCYITGITPRDCPKTKTDSDEAIGCRGKSMGSQGKVLLMFHRGLSLSPDRGLRRGTGANYSELLMTSLPCAPVFGF